MPTKQTLRECPFCGSDDVEALRLGRLDGAYAWQVGCIKCGALSAINDLKTKSIHVWNSAPRKSDVEALESDIKRLQNAVRKHRDNLNWTDEMLYDAAGVGWEHDGICVNCGAIAFFGVARPSVCPFCAPEDREVQP